jgi:hypothetical protein
VSGSFQPITRDAEPNLIAAAINYLDHRSFLFTPLSRDLPATFRLFIKLRFIANCFIGIVLL